MEASRTAQATLDVEPVMQATAMLVVMLKHTPPRGASRYAFAGMGSGFAIDRPGLLVTNRHNLEAADELRDLVRRQRGVEVELHVVFNSEESYLAEECFRADDADLAMIKIVDPVWKQRRPEWPHLMVSGVEEIGPNTAVWAVGFPAAAWEASRDTQQKVRFKERVMDWFDESALAHKFTTGIVSCKPYFVNNGMTPGRVILSGATINPGTAEGRSSTETGRSSGSTRTSRRTPRA